MMNIIEDKEIREKRYKYLIDIYLNESKEAWNTFIAFLITQTIIFSFTGKSMIDLIEGCSKLWTNDLIVYGSSAIGIITSWILLIVYKRCTEYNKFRLDQLKEIEPEGWDIFNGKVEKFLNGEIVKQKINVKGGSIYKVYKMRNLTIFKAKFWIPYFMKFFILAYIVLIVAYCIFRAN
jgi:hypothetical protein